MNSIRPSWLTLLVGVALAACQSDSVAPTPTTSGDDPAPSRIGPEEAVSRAADQLRFGFQPSEDGFRAEADTHDAEVSGGDLVMVPYHYDGVRSIVGATVRFSTTAVSRGEFSLADSAPAARLGDDRTVAIARGAVTETVENRDDGVEQSWHFGAAPDGDGDLLVAVAVSGHEEVQSSRTGLHFLSGERLGFSYSHAMWIDATRTAWNVPVSWDGQQIVMRVPASVLDRSAYPAVLDPVIGPERTVDGRVDGFSGGAASEPVIAGGPASTFLVVWTDGRNGSERASEVYAARVSGSGSPIDRHGLPVAHTTLLEHQPTVAWTGSEWLMAWTREDATNAGISAATVSPEGVVTDLGVIAGTFGHESQPALASAGSGDALLAYRWNQQIRAQRYTAGAFGSAIIVSAAEGNETFPVVAASGSNYLVAWQLGDAPGQDIWGRIVNQSGPSPAAFLVSDAPASLDMQSPTFNGTDYMLTWRRAGDIWGARVTTTGVVRDSTNGVGGVILSETPDNEAEPALACSATQCLLTWADRRDDTDPSAPAFDLIGQRFDFDLTPIGGVITIGDFVRNQTEPTVVATQNAFMVAWTDVRSGVRNLFATRVRGDGSVVTPNGVLVNTARRNAQSGPSHAIGTTNQLAVWSDSRAFGDDIMARRFTAGGGRVDEDARVVSDAEWDQASPVVSFDGSQFVAAWRDSRNPSHDIFAARMQQDGTLSDPAGIAVSTAPDPQIAPAIASGGGVTLVAWKDQRDQAASGANIMGAIIEPDGDLAVGDIAICQEADEQLMTAVAWDPNSSLFVVAWSDLRTDGAADIYAARVAPDGSVLDPCGVPITTATNWQQSPAIAVSGDQVLIVWEDFRDDFFGDVWGGRITTTGGAITRLDGNGVPIATGASWQTAPTTVGVGQGRWGIAWTDTINELTTGTDIVGNTMAPDGTLSIEPEYLISGGVYYEMGPQFQSGGGDSSTVWLMYEYDRPSTGVLTVRRREITY